MYSTTKSFVAVAIGFCEQDGLLSLDDPISKFFPEYVEREGAAQHSSTVRELLMMESSIRGVHWFLPSVTDRVATYFDHHPTKLPQTLFDYDSAGSLFLTMGNCLRQYRIILMVQLRRQKFRQTNQIYAGNSGSIGKEICAV